jgi:autotransporter translocation and assembly factor TamB
VLAGGERMRFFIDLACKRDDILFPYFGIEEYRADLDVNGIIEGSFESWDLRASGRSSGFKYRNFHVLEGEIKLAVIKDAGYQVFLDLQGDSCDFEQVGFSDLSFALEFADGITNIKELKLARPEFSLETRAEISSGVDYIAVDIGEVYVDAFEERWTGSGAFTVLFGDTDIVFNDIQFHSRLGALYIDGALNRQRYSFDGRVSFERLALDIANRAGILSMPLDGTARGSITCEGALRDPDLNFDLFVEHGSLDTVSIDSLRMNAAYSDGRFSFDSLAIDAPTGRVRVTGGISGLRLEDVYRRGGQALGGAVSDLGLECSGLLLTPILSIQARNRFSGGTFSGTVTITDSLVHPNVRLRGRLADLTVGSFRVPAADLLMDVAGNAIDLDGTIYIAPGHEGSFRGRIPLRPIEWLYELDMDRAISMELALEKGDFANVTELTDLIAEAKGGFYAIFNITGTPRHPKLLGEFNLSGAGFRLAGMEEKYDDVDAIVLLEDTMVVVKKFKGKEGRNGSFKCTGWISLKGWKPNRYHIEVDVEDALIASIPDILVIISGTLSVDSRIDGDRTIPVLTGSLVSKQAELFYDIGDFNGAGEKGTLAPPSWTAAVEIEVPGNAWLKTPDASVELQGDIVLYHDQRGTYLRGELDLVRGWYNVYNNKFRVRSGKLAFVHAESFRPVVDIEAETRDPEGRKIYLFLAWHQDDIEPRLSLQHEDPGYSETDIWKMLGGGIVGSSNGQGTNWDALSTAQSLAANYIERMLNSQMEGVTIELERTRAGGSTGGSFEEGETMIAIGKYLSEGLYVKYKQGLSISTARQIEVEYRISRLFLLRSEIIRYSEKVLQGKSGRSSDEINLDFKLRWEF